VLLAIAVKDTGIGILPEGIERIFTPFSQADDSISRRYGGAGLGLAISKRLVEFMGGTLSVASKVDDGSVFSFTIPTAAGREESPAKTIPGDTEEAPLHGMSILIAEDNAINRKVLEKILEKAGVSFDSAKDGAEAAKKGSDGGFDAILMDIEMPGMDGYEAARIIRRREKETGRRVPIIALSAHVSEEHRLKALEAGMDAFVSKPVRKADLLRTLAEATGRG
jgi:CheY-like chemotaxis protein